MGNPYLARDKGRGDAGRKSERRIAKKLGKRLQPGSGALEWAKGDIRLNGVLMENKSTVKDSISIKKEWLEKIAKEALAINCTPAVAISFTTANGQITTQDWVMIPMRVFKEISEK